MNILDVFILIVVVWALVKGWRSGLLREAASLVGFIIGLIVAKLLYGWLGAYLAPSLGTSPTLANIFAFIILWVVVPIALGIAARGLSKMIDDIPIVGKLNGLLGAGISFVKYMILLSCMVNVMAFIHIVDDEKQTQESAFYTPTKKFVGWAFDKVRSINTTKHSTDNADSLSVKNKSGRMSEGAE
jgi:membrane protein required for colicin V production